MFTKGIITELLWFLKGDTNIKYLVDNGCNIWNGDAYKSYCKIAGDYEKPDYDVHIEDADEKLVRLMTMSEFVDRIKTDENFHKRWGDLGPVYGRQWRNCSAIYDGGVDQIKNLIDDLKHNPDSRRLIVSAWNVSEIDKMVLPPCHWAFECYTEELSDEERIKLAGGTIQVKYPSLIIQQIKSCDERNIPKRKLSLKWHQRSVDTFLGLPFNIASYGLLLEMLAKEVNMVPSFLIGDLTNVHLYSNHIEQAKEQLKRVSFDLPRLEIHGEPIGSDISDYNINQFKFNGYESHPSIKAPLSN
jgi:thymidylate synthase